MIIHHTLPPVTPANAWVGIDSELFTKKGDVDHLHRPHTGKFACITIATDNENVYFIDKEEMVQEALNRVNNSVWCIQNAMFDLRHFRRWAKVPPRKKLFDPMLIERTLFNGYYDGFSLQDLSRRYLHTKMDKEIRDEFIGASDFTQERIEYACLDAIVHRKVSLEQKKFMSSDDRNVWSTIDLPALWAFLDFQGFRIDVDKWSTLAQINLDKQEEIVATLPFNPNSPKQVVAWMSVNGFKKLDSSDVEHLEAAVIKYPNTKAAEVANLVLKSRKYGKNAGTYGMNFINDFLEDEGNGVYTIYADYGVIGAATGRTSCSNPNMQNIPARETKQYRECFISRPNHTLVIADYGAQEPRILAYVSQDKYLLDCFNSGKDPYISLAKDAFGETITKKDPRRKLYKDVVLAIGYGLTKYGLSKKVGITKELAQDLIDKTSKILKGAADWGNNQEKETSFVTTPFGRKYWLNMYKSGYERNARNSPIQGGAADMMKKTLASMYSEWPFPFPFCAVGMVHDEAIFDFPDEYAVEGEEYVKTHMEEGSTKMVGGSIKFIAETYHGKTWAEK